MQADEPKQPVKSAAPVAHDLPKPEIEPSVRTLELMFDAKKVLTEQLEQAEQMHQEFRQKSPFLFIKSGDPLAKLVFIESKRTDLQLRRVNLQSQLAAIKNSIKSTDPIKNQEQAAMVALMKLQMRGVDIAAIKNAITTDGKITPTAPELVLLYSEAMQSELDEMENTGRALDDLYDREQKLARERSYSELQDDRLRNKVIQCRLLLEAITKKLAEFTPSRTEQGK